MMVSVLGLQISELPAVSAGWVISNESFSELDVSQVEFAEAESQLWRYREYYQLYGHILRLAPVNYGGMAGYEQFAGGNRFRLEKTHSTDLAIDLGFRVIKIRHRWTGTQNNKDLFVPGSYQRASGFTTVWDNLEP